MSKPFFQHLNVLLSCTVNPHVRLCVVVGFVAVDIIPRRGLSAISVPSENLLSSGFVPGKGRRAQGDERKRSRLRLGCRRTLLIEKK